ncbi:hypothetical protein DPMN_169824 [Dreissena polymorpha]|uniref:Uncharacterized protein n=1 Tax=Dreissena polymorpha TaxID=45954 RepID=A0A9D4ICC3_DREPO|nr:hypothetical protein DPMN_169824 [Dreissena polymorpha]
MAIFLQRQEFSDGYPDTRQNEKTCSAGSIYADFFEQEGGSAPVNQGRHYDCMDAGDPHRSIRDGTMICRSSPHRSIRDGTMIEQSAPVNQGRHYDCMDAGECV